MSLLETRVQNFRSRNKNLDKWEYRAGRWGFYDLFTNQTNSPTSVVTEDLKKQAIAAFGSTLEMPVIDYDSGVSVQNITIPLVTAGDPSTSQMVEVTFTDYYWGFKIFPAQHFNNEIRMQTEFDVQMKKHIYKFLDLLDISCGATLEAEKTQVLNDDLGGRYALVGNTVEAPLVEQNSFIGDLGILFSGNDYFGNVHMVGNGSMESFVRNNLMEKGEFNTENKTYQYSDKTWHFSNNLSNASGHKATAFAVQEDSVGFVQQFAADCVMGNKSHKHTWDIVTLPIANMPFGYYFYDDAENISAVSGAATALNTASLVQSHAFHARIAKITAYNSAPATRASSVMKGAIKTT